MEEIAKCHPRIVSLSLGSEDFAADAGMQSEPEGLFYPKQHMLFAARAAGILPMGFVGSIADFRDQDAFRAIVRRSRRLGFLGASAIHPLQIQVLNEKLSPIPVEAHVPALSPPMKTPTPRASGAVQFEGAMIDVPVVERARTVLKRAAAIRKRVGA